MDFINCYEDVSRADAYATLEFANTYYLAYRDLPAIMSEHVTGTRALDFGCGTGRSTRFLRKLGFNVTGVDIAEDMLRIARALDPAGDYRIVPRGDLSEFAPETSDLIVSLFTLAGADLCTLGSAISRMDFWEMTPVRKCRSVLPPGGPSPKHRHTGISGGIMTGIRALLTIGGTT